ncbi:hypothetical protein [Acidianus brierleyi]|uniref:Uncharacterized protein n=1 Tax=Acidianus brierleyi TaxID=41673 RepID=A0A2U9IB56_9CREN|nr:hypothetical protein [Acidianus brierleyi]AWR93248.1 hypothetical protein DFR85_00100 [Acidianus brierleyi]
MTEKDLIIKSKELAKNTVMTEFRKALGKYYISWGTFPLSFGLAYFILNFLNLYSYISFSISITGILIFYILLSIRFFRKARKILNNFISIFGENSRKIHIFEYYIYPFLLIISFVFLGVGAFFFNIIFLIFGSTLYAISVDISLYFLYKTANGIKYYDILALITFTMLMTLSETRFIEFFSMIFGISWIFAGYKSLMEVIESD